MPVQPVMSTTENTNANGMHTTAARMQNFKYRCGAWTIRITVASQLVQKNLTFLHILWLNGGGMKIRVLFRKLCFCGDRIIQA